MVLFKPTFELISAFGGGETGEAIAQLFAVRTCSCYMS